MLLTHKGTEDILTGGEKLRLTGLSGGRSEVKSGRSSQEQQAAPRVVWAAGSRLDGPASVVHVLEPLGGWVGGSALLCRNGLLSQGAGTSPDR